MNPSKVSPSLDGSKSEGLVTYGVQTANSNMHGNVEREDQSWAVQPNNSRIAIAYGVSENQRAEVRLTDYSRQITSGGGKPGQGYLCVFQPRYYTRDNKTGGAPSETADITNAHKAGDSAPCVAFQLTGDRDNPGVSTYDDVHPTIPANPMSDRKAAVAIDVRNLREQPDNTSGTLQHKKTGGYSLNYQNPVAGQFGVRRLTPMEAERLQGFPDGWTLVNGMSDSARYRMLGNAVAVPCAEWIGQRIIEVA